MSSDSPGISPVPIAMSPPLRWFELFYDLVYVAAIIVFSNALAHDATWGSVASVAGVFSVVWFVWLSTVSIQSQFSRDDPIQRGLTLVQMLMVTLVAVAVGDGVPEHARWIGIFAAALLVVTALMFARPRIDNDDNRSVGLRAGACVAIGACCLGMASFVAGPLSSMFWVLGGLLVAATTLSIVGTDAGAVTPMPSHAMLERFGAFTIIVCGESFVKVALTAADGTLDAVDLWVMVFEFVLVFSIWWGYFADIPEAGVPHRGARRVTWVALHLPLHLALVGVAIGASKFILAAPEQDLTLKKTVMLALPLVLVFLSLGMIGWVSPRRAAGSLVVLRFSTAALVAIVVAVWWYDSPGGAEGLFVALSLIALVSAGWAGRLLERIPPVDSLEP